MTSGLTRICAALSALISLLAWQPASAKQLSNEACTKLVNEHAELWSGSVEKVIAIDPAKAGEELKPEQLANIERFLFIDGQIRFRCPHIRLPDIKEPDVSKKQEARVDKPELAPPKQPEDPPVPLPERKPALPKQKSG